MDALLSALLVCLLCEVGGANQQLTLALARRFDRDSPVIAGIACAAFANAAISAASGWFISTMIAADARSLFLALSLLLAGAGILVAAKRPNDLHGWRTGAFTTVVLGLFILGFADGAQFVILGIATRTADPVMTTIGGGLGVFVACLPIALLRQSVPPRLSMIVRRVGGCVLLLIGTALALSAIKLL